MPDTETSHPPQTYEIGLCMAGAVSAGAYTAGVMDFLIQAMDAWEAVHGEDGMPGHDVKLSVMSGASAGAITSAIAARSLYADVEAATDVRNDNPPEAEDNRLYDAWVRQVDIKRLLGTSDLAGSHPIPSLLNSEPLWDIAQLALDVKNPGRKRNWVSDPMPVFMTVTNLRGVNYAFHLNEGDEYSEYGMTHHGDFTEFSVGQGTPFKPSHLPLDPTMEPTGNWQLLAQSALASGAFPVGLASRHLTRPFSDYDHRPFGQFISADNPPDTYEFMASDGGSINNEPLEVARRYLADKAGRERNPREGDRAFRSVVMIDPFPNVASTKAFKGPKSDAIRDALSLFGALINQARFKPEELRLAESEENFSRYQISPRRDNLREGESAIASGCCQAFGGFLAEKYRQHDFQLGRYNCQRFLQRWFYLPECNDIMEAQGEAFLAQWCIKPDGVTPVRDENGHRLIPIVPLVGSATDRIDLLDPPSKASVEMDALKYRIGLRARAVSEKAYDLHISKLIPAWARRLLRGYFRSKISNKATTGAMDWIDNELDVLK